MPSNTNTSSQPASKTTSTSTDSASLYSMSSTAPTLNNVDNRPSKKKFFSFGKGSSEPKSSSDSEKKRLHNEALATYMTYRH